MVNEEEVREWFNYALRDYNTAIYLQNMRPVPIEIICYHCQQSAEKYLKGFLISMKKPLIKTHDLAFLVTMCIDVDGDFKFIQSVCEDLTDYSIISRYPSNNEINNIDMKKALQDSLVIKDFIEKKILI